MPPETLGYEWDSDSDNGYRPAGEIDMSQTCEKVDQKLYTVTEELVSDNACNSLTLYRASSGALVFDAGTVQWSWGFDSTPTTTGTRTTRLTPLYNRRPSTCSPTWAFNRPRWHRA
jgi:hypothetical protein